MKLKLRRATLTLLSLLALSLGACGNSDDASDTSATTVAPADFNAQDVTFARGMIEHHQGAIDMAKLAATNANSPDVKALAAQIEADQGPEMATMNSWLFAWNQPATADASGHSMAGMTGMTDDNDLQGLGATSGNAFDRAFLTKKTTHHQGAVDMARVEIASGQSTEAKTLAGSIATSQTAQIATMAKLLSTLPV